MTHEMLIIWQHALATVAESLASPNPLAHLGMALLELDRRGEHATGAAIDELLILLGCVNE